MKRLRPLLLKQRPILPGPDFAKMAEDAGIPGLRAETPDQVRTMI